MLTVVVKKKTSKAPKKTPSARSARMAAGRAARRVQAPRMAALRQPAPVAGLNRAATWRALPQAAQAVPAAPAPDSALQEDPDSYAQPGVDIAAVAEPADDPQVAAMPMQPNAPIPMQPSMRMRPASAPPMQQRAAPPARQMSASLGQAVPASRPPGGVGAWPRRSTAVQGQALVQAPAGGLVEDSVVQTTMSPLKRAYMEMTHELAMTGESPAKLSARHIAEAAPAVQSSADLPMEAPAEDAPPAVADQAASGMLVNAQPAAVLPFEQR
eukprot:TRINITY_DN18109_c0_g1_i4.p1 TRINITY_DN18109_c0_g1~~TRINITY_DN18109_c0_g1_i4.p1  ORF type:complete len:270 (+),score=46.85 TRINITY_DN18109_c0_g1_i4:540-1349(+)